MQEISTQGFTVLYRSKRYGRWYALKTLNEDTAQQMAYAQVLRKELEELMQMQHPNVVQAVKVLNLVAVRVDNESAKVKGELADARKATDEAIRRLYDVLNALAFCTAPKREHRLFSSHEIFWRNF